MENLKLEKVNDVVTAEDIDNEAILAALEVTEMFMPDKVC